MPLLPSKQTRRRIKLKGRPGKKPARQAAAAKKKGAPRQEKKSVSYSKK